MSYLLEQGIYFIAHSKFETTSGLGLRAVSLEDRESLQAMRAAAAVVNFYSDRTEYSFLYSGSLGFVLAASTTRMPEGESRRTPYIHMIFSGRHPHNAPESYGFQAVYETGEQDISGLVARAEATPMPLWKLPDLSREQLAWLIRRLWSLLSSRPSHSGDWPLLLSPDSLPQEWGPPLRLAQIMCALAELIPPSFREALSGTTANPALKGADTFPICLSSSPEAYRLDDLPALELEQPEDYFTSFCLKMAQAYHDEPETFRLIMDHVDQDGLLRLCQPTAERQELAACCAVMKLEPPWRLEGAALSAMQKRVETMLPNQREDRAFWEEQMRNLKSCSPPIDLPDLLKWLEQEEKNPDEQIHFLEENYELSPDRFLSQGICLRDGPEALLKRIWNLTDAEKIIGSWEPEDMGMPSVFYPYLADQLHFWGGISLNWGVKTKAQDYFFARLGQGPDPALEDVIPLLQDSRSLLPSESLKNLLTRAIEGESRLPDLRLLQKIPEKFLNWGPPKDLLTGLWKNERPADGSAFDQWKESGKFLRIPNFASTADKYIRNQIDFLETPQDAALFVEQFQPYLSTSPNALGRKLADFVRQTETREELEQLEKAAESIGWTGDAVLQKKLKRLRLEDQLRQGGLSGLLRMVKDEPDIRGDDPDLVAQWRERMRSCLEELGESGSLGLAPEDIDLIDEAVRVLGRADRELAHELCDRFLREYCPALEDVGSIRVQYMSLLEDDIQRHAQRLAKQSTLEEVYVYEKNRSFYHVRASSEAWANLSWKDRAEICVRACKDGASQRIYEDISVRGDSFCELVCRLRVSSHNCMPFDDGEIKALLGCLAELTVMLPEQEKTMECLLWLWQRNPTGPNETLCLELVRQIEQVTPRPGDRQVKCARKIWKSVFSDRGHRTLLEDAWKQRKKKGRGPLPGPASPAEAPRDLPEDELSPKPENRLLNSLDIFLVKCDSAIERLFCWTGKIFRAPIWLMRKLLRLLMRR